MIEWIATIFIVVTGWSLRIGRYTPAIMRFLIYYATACLLNSITFNYIVNSATAEVTAEIWINLVFATAIFSTIVVGDFRYTYCGICVAVQVLLYYLLNFTLKTLTSQEPYPEVAMSFVQFAASYIVLHLLTIRLEAKKVFRDYRIWIVLAFASYYLFAFLAFVGNYLGIDWLWDFHGVGAFTWFACALVSLYIWRFRRELRLTLAEEFPLPESIKQKIRFLHVPKEKLSNVSPNYTS